MNGKKVLLVGWDGADWRVINPLLDAGKMPHLERFVNEGVSGNLATLFPDLSPMLWTSIATGKRPFKHGVLGFTEPNPHSAGVRPISGYSRKTRAIWNILHLQGMRSNVVGWWPSHPAEPIRGVMVSNHYSKARGPIDKPWPLPPGTVHPKRLQKNLADLRLHPQELASEHIGPFVPDFAKIDQEKDRRLEMLAKIIAECTSIHAAATALIQLEPWDFMAVYYDAIDHFSHAFMRFHPPRMEGVSEDSFDLFKGVVEGGYRYHDMMLGVLLALAGEETTVMLVSDHGFHPDHLRPHRIPVEPAGPAVQHRQQGIFVIKGPGIKKDEIIHGASLLDITPTILTLFGLSVGEDMDGAPLVNAFYDPPQVTTIPSWDSVPGEDGSYSEEEAIDPVASREAINQLVAMGYIEKPDEDVEKAMASTVRELDYDLARSYMDANRHFDAIPFLERLIQEWPDEPRFGLALVRCYHALERPAEARRVLDATLIQKKETAAQALEDLKEWRERLEETKPEDLSEKEKHELRRLRSKVGYNPFGIELLMAEQLLAEGDAAAALERLENVEKINPEATALHQKRGEAYLKLKEGSNAEESFTKTLKIDPDNVAAHIGLCRSLLQRRKNAAAAEAALDALGLSYANPTAHFLLGVALHRMNRPIQAVEALKVAVLQNPNHVLALERLGYIYEKRIKDTEMAREYRNRAREAKQQVRDMKAGKIKPKGPVYPKRTAITSDVDVLEYGENIPSKIDTPLAETITIVSGLPRSGTSMMMQMLAAGDLISLADDLRPADAHNERGYYEYARAKRLAGDTSWLSEARGKAVKIVAQLMRHLPAGKGHNYAVLFVERSVDEVLASQRDMLADRKKRGARLPESVLRHTFLSQLNHARKLLSFRRTPTLYIRYQDCLENPPAAAARINGFLGGGLEEAAMARAVDPALHRHKR